MKKIAFFTLLLSFLSCNLAKAQSLYGMTYNGGVNNNGTLFEFNTQTQLINGIPSFKKVREGGGARYLEMKELNGKFYGMTASGGPNDDGVIFEWNPSTNEFITKIFFNLSTINGRKPYGSLTLYNGKFYGMTTEGGSFNLGTIFEWDPNTNIISKKIDFFDFNAENPQGDLTLYNDKFYGVTRSGGANDHGLIFEWNPDNNVFTTKFDFNASTTGGYPTNNNLTLYKDKFYGLTTGGNVTGAGVLYEFDPSNDTFIKKYEFIASSGANPVGTLQVLNDKLYGMTLLGGASGSGVIFEWDIATETYTAKFSLSTFFGTKPYGSLTFFNNKFYGLCSEGGANGFGTLWEWDPSTNNFSKRKDFGNDGKTPLSTLALYNNKLYATTFTGGSSSYGVIFEYEPATDIYTKKCTFNVTNGKNPQNGLTFFQGKFYGLCNVGGEDDAGTLFEFDYQSNTFTVKYEFDKLNGARPSGELIAYNGKLYGVTNQGGQFDVGTIFEYDPNTNVYTKKFDFNSTIGSFPAYSLTLYKKRLYGLTFGGGASNAGTIFEWNPATNIHLKRLDFSSTIGMLPLGKLTLYQDKFYGLTYQGGAYNGGVIFEWEPLDGTYTKKFDFLAITGVYPIGSLTLYGNKLYGLTTQGGLENSGGGVLFEWNPTSNEYAIKVNLNNSIGRNPSGHLVVYNNLLYGLTYNGGANNLGVVFAYDPQTETYSRKASFANINGALPQSSSLAFVPAQITNTNNHSLYLDGVNDYVSIPNNSILELSNGTIEAWLRPDWVAGSNGGQNPCILAMRNSTGTRYSLHIQDNYSGIGLWNGSTYQIRSFSFTKGQWYHIAFVDSGTTTEIFINGVSIGSTNNGFNTAVTGRPLTIGWSNQVNNEYFTGQIDEVRIWNTVRTATEISTQMNSELSGLESGLVAYYQANDGVEYANNASVLIFRDKSNFNNNGTLVNFLLNGCFSNWVCGAPALGLCQAQDIRVYGIQATHQALIPYLDNTPSIFENTFFGNWPVADNLGKAHTYQINNVGGLPLIIQNIQLLGANSADFQLVTSFTFPIQIPVGSSLSFQIKFTPSAVGARVATLQIQSNDCSESSYSFVLQGNGITNNALYWDGVDDYVSIANQTVLETDNGTIEAWIRPDWVSGSNGGQNPCILAMRNSTGTRYSLHIQDNYSGIGLWNGINYFVLPFGFVKGQWYHIALVDYGTNSYIYINGDFMGNLNNAFNTAITGKPLTIGWSNQLTNEYFTGQIDEVRIWGDVRTCTEIKAYRNCELKGNETDLLAYYSFNQGIPAGNNAGQNTLNNLTINALNGTLTNFALNGAISNWTEASNGVGVNCQNLDLPQIEVLVNGSQIYQDSSVDFGAVGINQTRIFTFTIQNANKGANALKLLSASPNFVFISGNAEFSLTAQPTNPIITANNAQTFRITYDPSAIGVNNTATIQIFSNDCLIPVFSFSLKGLSINENTESFRGNMLQLDGINDYVQIANNAALELSNGTIEAWVRPNWVSGSNGGQNPCILAMRNSSGTRYSLHIQDNYSGIGLWNGSTYQTRAFSFTQGQWYHIAYVESGTTTEIFINGVSIGSTNNAFNTAVTGRPLTIGWSNQVNNEYFTGQIDELRIWSIARTRGQIRNQMHLTLQGNETGLVAYYQFNEISGNCIDKIANQSAGLFNGANRPLAHTPVSAGICKRLIINDLGDNQFHNLKINFDSFSGEGEFGAYELYETPYNNFTNLTTTSHYWIVRQFGTGATFTYRQMDFIIPTGNVISPEDEASPINLHLYKRNSNEFLANWGVEIATADWANNNTKEINFSLSPAQSSFSQFIIASVGTSPLPLTWLSFDAIRLDEKTVKLHWQTTAEVNNRGFEIEQSENGVNFYAIGFQDSQGNFQTVNHYQFRLNNSQSAYYRIKQVDNDGKFSYSTVRYVAATLACRLYPNPSAGEIKLEMELAKNAPIILNIYNSQGLICLQTQGKLEEINQLLNQKLTHWANGVYLLQIKTAQEIIHKRLILRR
jgi:uncharacterized repeat protein (TIGR03803 family)